MVLTGRQLNRATLARQLLLRREPLGVAEGVRRVVAVQAQEAASPYLALWNRLTGFDPAGLDAAFAGQEVVKATLMRATLHAVHAADYPAFQSAMAGSLRASRLGDARFADVGLTAAEADAAVPDLLEFLRQPRTNAECQAAIDERLGARPKPGLWWALRTYAPVVHAPTGGPWSFGPRPAYVAARPTPADGDRDGARQRLVRRYLEGFGPASPADVAQFVKLARSTVRAALAGLAGELRELEGPGGVTLYDVPGGALPDGDTPAPPRLMAMWDSVLLAYADRGRVLPADHRGLVIRSNGDTLPTLLVDGHVAGVWRPVAGGIEATAFHRLSDADWHGLETEACALVAFLADRDPTVYRRYARWWDRLPAAETRVLPGMAPSHG